MVNPQAIDPLALIRTDDPDEEIVIWSNVVYECTVTVVPPELSIVLPRPWPLKVMELDAEAPVIVPNVTVSVNVAAETLKTTGPDTPFDDKSEIAALKLE